MRYLRIGLIALLGIVQMPVIGQGGLPLGAWRSHFSYQDANEVVEIEGIFYVLSRGGLYKYNSTDNSISKLGSVEGFRTSPISTIGNFGGELGIGYENGLIDLLDQEGNIWVLRDIFESDFLSKRINEIKSVDGKVMISTNFGLVIYNQESRKVIESYWQFDNSSTEYKILSATEHQQILYLVGEGVVFMGLNDGTINLLDFNNWTVDNSFSQPSFVETSGNQLLLASDQDGLFSRESGNWVLQGLESHSFTSLLYENTMYLISTDLGLFIYDGNSLISHDYPIGVTQVNQFSITANLEYYATQNHGLVIINQQGQESIFPEGPAVEEIWQLKSINDRIVLVGGGYDTTFSPHGNESAWSLFENNIWKSFNSEQSSMWASLSDIVAIEWFQDNMYLSSFGKGVWRFDEENEQIEQLVPPVEIDVSQIILMMSDPDGLWMVSSSENLPLIHLDNSGEYRAFFTNTTVPHFFKEIHTNSKYVFLRVDTSSKVRYILAIEKSTGLWRIISTNESEGNLPGEPLSMAIDKRGYLWVGTTKGVAYFSGFSITGEIEAIRPILNNGYLFSGERINTLNFDEGDRLWIGTSQGLWLIDENIQNQLDNLNTNNSPLISNKIVSIALNNESGELFILTDKGLFSYGARAVRSEVNFDRVKIFPNPVEPGYGGEVGIKGLINSSDIRITTTAGYLVWQGISAGGMAAWDLKDLAGNRVESGVYFVFSTNENGEEVLSGKILVVR